MTGERWTGKRFWLGVAASAVGLSGVLAGVYWDPLNGRELETGGFGPLQAAVVAGGLALCIVGLIVLLLPPGGKGVSRGGKRTRPRARRRKNVKGVKSTKGIRSKISQGPS